MKGCVYASGEKPELDTSPACRGAIIGVAWGWGSERFMLEIDDWSSDTRSLVIVVQKSIVARSEKRKRLVDSKERRFIGCQMGECVVKLVVDPSLDCAIG